MRHIRSLPRRQPSRSTVIQAQPKPLVLAQKPRSAAPHARLCPLPPACINHTQAQPKPWILAQNPCIVAPRARPRPRPPAPAARARSCRRTRARSARTRPPGPRSAPQTSRASAQTAAARQCRQPSKICLYFLATGQQYQLPPSSTDVKGCTSVWMLETYPHASRRHQIY